MSLVPIVYPGIDTQGVETSPEITALFGQALELGSVESSPVVLIKKQTEYLDNQIENVEIEVSLKRIDLTTLTEVQTKDYGDGVSPGGEYRHQLIIKPVTPLDQNSQYSVIIPKELSLITVFDAVEGGSNASPIIDVKGVYKGLAADEYQVRITSSGSQSRCYYEWERLSDGHIETGIRGRRRFIEIERGLKIRFPDGDYTANDTYNIKVQPEQKIGSLYTWGFSTGTHDHAVPEDNHSNSSVDLPVTGGEPTGTTSSVGFNVEAVFPEFADSRMLIGQYSSVTVGNITIKTKDRTSTYNNKEIEVLDTATSGAETLNVVDDLITIGVEEGVTTNQVVVDLINASALNSDVEASSLLLSDPAILSSAKQFSKGVNRNQIILSFTKNIDPSSVSAESIKLMAENLLDYSHRELNYTYTVLDKDLTITIED